MCSLVSRPRTHTVKRTDNGMDRIMARSDVGPMSPGNDRHREATLEVLGWSTNDSRPMRQAVRRRAQVSWLWTRGDLFSLGGGDVLMAVCSQLTAQHGCSRAEAARKRPLTQYLVPCCCCCCCLHMRKLWRRSASLMQLYIRRAPTTSNTATTAYHEGATQTAACYPRQCSHCHSNVDIAACA